MGYWASIEFEESLKIPIRRFTDRIQPESGLVIWSAMRWYPALLLTYAGGIGAVASGNYTNLNTLLHVAVPDLVSQSNPRTGVTAFYDFFTRTADAFKVVPGHEKNYVPRSEYLYKLLQPMIDDILFLGADYERVFDRFEILLSLEFGHLFEHEVDRVWAPVGRFGWKHTGRGTEGSPLVHLIAEGEQQEENWGPIKAGLFGGSYERFAEIAKQFLEFANKLPFY